MQSLVGYSSWLLFGEYHNAKETGVVFGVGDRRVACVGMRDKMRDAPLQENTSLNVRHDVDML